MGSLATIKTRDWSVLAEFVPTSYNPDDPDERGDVAEQSGLDYRSHDSSRWIKPPKRREKARQSAHLILRFNDPVCANQAILNGVIITNKRVRVRKLEEEARRCLNCQSFDPPHSASEYTNPTVCSTCGKDHHSEECTVKDPDQFHCANCNITGHGAWSRECEIRLSHQKKLEACRQDSNFRFFPTSESWTWETLSLSLSPLLPFLSPPAPK
jgi:hypothetical protein